MVERFLPRAAGPPHAPRHAIHVDAYFWTGDSQNRSSAAEHDDRAFGQALGKRKAEQIIERRLVRRTAPTHAITYDSTFYPPLCTFAHASSMQSCLPSGSLIQMLFRLLRLDTGSVAQRQCYCWFRGGGGICCCIAGTRPIVAGLATGNFPRSWGCETLAISGRLTIVRSSVAPRPRREMFASPPPWRAFGCLSYRDRFSANWPHQRGRSGTLSHGIASREARKFPAVLPRALEEISSDVRTRTPSRLDPGFRAGAPDSSYRSRPKPPWGQSRSAGPGWSGRPLR